ncbi:aldo/keto reductase [Gemmatimonadota bacterium]
MEYINLGSTGLKVSPVCLGCMSFGTKKWREWVLEEDESRTILRKAVEVGINFFDTANMYSMGVSEEITGRALADFTDRDRIVLATKVYFPMEEGPNGGGLSRKHIISQVEKSLKRLGTDYIDLYQIHRWDYTVPMEETLRALDDLVRQGKVHHIGASSMWAHQFAESLHLSDMLGLERFETMQNHYNLIYREEEREMNPLCEREGVGIIPWSPLARGLLTGTRTREELEPTLRARLDEYGKTIYEPLNDFDIIDRLVEVSAEQGEEPAAMALAWLLHQPGVVAPIIGVTKPEQLDAAIRAPELQLSAVELDRLEEFYLPHSVQGHE